MNLLKNISTRDILRPSSLIIIICIIITILAMLIGSHDLATQVDIKNIYLAPFENADFILGTDGLGRSVAYGLINGIKVSLAIAFFTGLVSILVGLLFSFVAGYLGNDKLKISNPIKLSLILTSSIALFYLWYSFTFIFLLLWFLVSYLLLYIDKTVFINYNKKSIPLDSMIMKIVALIKSLPGIFLILFSFALIPEFSLIHLVALITFVRIPSIVRLTRSEVLKIKNQEYILAAEGMGLKTIETFVKHIIPNILTPLTTYFIYTMATTILIESTLSFLGLGLSLDTVSLGSMLSSSREYFGAWWLAILPGGIIFLMIYSIRKLIGQKTESTDYIYL